MCGRYAGCAAAGTGRKDVLRKGVREFAGRWVRAPVNGRPSLTSASIAGKFAGELKPHSHAAFEKEYAA
jgi:hypothetical protein